MTYPKTPGFQAHSETSKDAALRLSASDLRSRILENIKISGEAGRTIDDISIIFDIVPGTASARIRELEMSGDIVKTKRKMMTRKKRNAFVYVASNNWRESMGKSIAKNQHDSVNVIKLQLENKLMRDFIEKILHAHESRKITYNGEFAFLCEAYVRQARKLFLSDK